MKSIGKSKAIKSDLIMIGLIFLLTLLLLSSTSCKHEPQIIPKPLSETTTDTNGNGNNSSTCSPDSIYFQKTILPLLISNCAKSGCHDAITHKDGIVLDSYQNIMNHGDVRPFNPGNSDLIEVITDSDPDDRMPPAPYPALSQSEITLLTNWIRQGALNNNCSDGNCDTSTVTFSSTISSILQTKCVGCHNNSLPSGQINLSGYANVLIRANSGSLLGSIDHQSGFFPMPKGGAKLSACEIASVRTWIRNGAPNN